MLFKHCSRILNTINWGDYKRNHLKSALNPKYRQNQSAARKVCVETGQSSQTQACSTSEAQTCSSQKQACSTSYRGPPFQKGPYMTWNSRRPIASNESHSNLSEKYTELANIKIQINKIKLEKVKMELALRRDSLELDIKIKKHIRRKWLILQICFLLIIFLISAICFGIIQYTGCLRIKYHEQKNL